MKKVITAIIALVLALITLVPSFADGVDVADGLGRWQRTLEGVLSEEEGYDTVVYARTVVYSDGEEVWNFYIPAFPGSCFSISPNMKESEKEIAIRDIAKDIKREFNAEPFYITAEDAIEYFDEWYELTAYYVIINGQKGYIIDHDFYPVTFYELQFDREMALLVDIKAIGEKASAK